LLLHLGLSGRRSIGGICDSRSYNLLQKFFWDECIILLIITKKYWGRLEGRRHLRMMGYTGQVWFSFFMVVFCCLAAAGRVTGD
jgi:hypothetical protein